MSDLARKLTACSVVKNTEAISRFFGILREMSSAEISTEKEILSQINKLEEIMADLVIMYREEGDSFE